MYTLYCKVESVSYQPDNFIEYTESIVVPLAQVVSLIIPEFWQ